MDLFDDVNDKLSAFEQLYNQSIGSRKVSGPLKKRAPDPVDKVARTY